MSSERKHAYKYSKFAIAITNSLYGYKKTDIAMDI